MAAKTFPPKQNAGVIKKHAGAMIGMLAAQFLLGMSENLMGKPDELHGAEKIVSGITLMLHVLIGLGLLIRGTILLRTAMSQGSTALSKARLGGLGVVVAFVSGILNTATTTGDSWWSFTMSVGFLMAFLAYGALYAQAVRK